jgi:hypothetical protein
METETETPIGVPSEGADGGRGPWNRPGCRPSRAQPHDERTTEAMRAVRASSQQTSTSSGTSRSGPREALPIMGLRADLARDEIPASPSRSGRVPAGRRPHHSHGRRISADLRGVVRLRRRVRAHQHDARLRQGAEHAPRPARHVSSVSSSGERFHQETVVPGTDFARARTSASLRPGGTRPSRAPGSRLRCQPCGYREREVPRVIAPTIPSGSRSASTSTPAEPNGCARRPSGAPLPRRT